MKTVWKYPLLWTHPHDMVLDMPEGAEPIHFGFQEASPYVWALVDTEQPKKRRTFVLLGTGHEFPGREYLKHIGSTMIEQTPQVDVGLDRLVPGLPTSFVFHLFEKLAEF